MKGNSRSTIAAIGGNGDYDASLKPLRSLIFEQGRGFIVL
jgi:hypothetical protein